MTCELTQLVFFFDGVARRFDALSYGLSPAAQSPGELLSTRLDPLLRAVLGEGCERREYGCRITAREIELEYRYRPAPPADPTGLRAWVRLHESFDAPDGSSLVLTLHECTPPQAARFHHDLMALPGLLIDRRRRECARLELLLAHGGEAGLETLANAVRVAGRLQDSVGG